LAPTRYPLHPWASVRCRSRRTRAPAFLVVPRELEVVALARHADRYSSDAGPRVEPRAESVEGAIVGWARESGEAGGCSQELAALVEHALLDHVVGPSEH
jgi:hypothetical protein